MKVIIDFIPLILFFIFYKIVDIYLATAVLMIATLLQGVLLFALFRKVEKMQLLTIILVLIFGGLTLALHSDSFIKWKVTILYSLFALLLAGAQWMGSSPLEKMLGKELTLPTQIWRKIGWAWALFFVVCAVTNLYIAFYLPLDIWVNFKVFGLLSANLVFIIGTALYVHRQSNKEADHD